MPLRYEDHGTAGKTALDLVDISRHVKQNPASYRSRLPNFSQTASQKTQREWRDMQIYFLPKPPKSERQFELEVSRLPMRRQVQRRIVKAAQCGEAQALLRLLREHRRAKLNRAYSHYATHDRLTRSGKKKRVKSGPKLTPLSWAALNGHADCARMLVDGVPGETFPGVFLYSESTVMPGGSAILPPQLQQLAKFGKPSPSMHSQESGMGLTARFPSTWASTNMSSTSSLGLGGEGQRVPRADIEASDPEGRTALMLAVYAGHANVVKVLLERGADILKGDKCSRNSVNYAAQSNRLKIEAMLKNELEARKQAEAKRKLEEEKLLKEYYARIMKQKKRPGTAGGSRRKTTRRARPLRKLFDGRPATASWGRRRSAAMLQAITYQKNAATK